MKEIRWTEALQQKPRRDQQPIFMPSDKRGDSVTRTRRYRTYYMQNARQYTRTSVSSSPAAIAETTQQAAYTQKPPDKGGNMKRKSTLVLTEFVSIFCADRRNDSVRKRGSLIRFRLINDMSDARPALTFTRRLRSILCKAF